MIARVECGNVKCVVIGRLTVARGSYCCACFFNNRHPTLFIHLLSANVSIVSISIDFITRAYFGILRVEIISFIKFEEAFGIRSFS